MLMLGACKVGKSALVNRWCKDIFIDNYVPTVEEFYTKGCNYLGQNVRIGAIDLTGGGHFPAMQDLYIQRTDSIIFVYEVGKMDTINEVKRLFDHVTKIRGENEVMCSVVGTKIDQNQDTGEGLEDLLQHLGNPKHITTSAKFDINIDRAFENSVSGLIAYMIPNEESLKKKCKEPKSKLSSLCCCLR